jgi:Zn-finger nucleic acid-binding protein
MPCNYCVGKDFAGEKRFFQIGLSISNDRVLVTSYNGVVANETEIYYCPMCGRKLEGESELDRIVKKWKEEREEKYKIGTVSEISKPFIVNNIKEEENNIPLKGIKVSLTYDGVEFCNNLD